MHFVGWRHDRPVIWAAITVASLSVSSASEVELDKESIEQALAKANGVIAQAVADLGLSRQTLYRRMDRLGISR